MLGKTERFVYTAIIRKGGKDVQDWLAKRGKAACSPSELVELDELAKVKPEEEKEELWIKGMESIQDMVVLQSVLDGKIPSPEPPMPQLAPTPAPQPLQLSIDELREGLKTDKQHTATLARALRSPGGPRIPLGPLTREQVTELCEQVDRSFLTAARLAEWETQADVAEVLAVKSQNWDLYGLAGKPPAVTIEKPQPDRTRREPQSPSPRSQRPMWKVDTECPTCHKHVSEVPFNPTPGKPIYCENCAREQRLLRRSTPQGNVGDAIQKAVEEKDRRIKELEEELAGRSPGGSDKMPLNLSKKEQKAWRRQHRGEQDEQT